MDLDKDGFIGANVWMRIPSGWIAAIAKDKKYCIDDRSLNVICKVVVNHIQVFICKNTHEVRINILTNTHEMRIIQSSRCIY